METFFAQKPKKIHKKFKSYYVVWKHFPQKKNVDEKESLNRTM